jgi:small multidrug resistance pump
MSFRKFLYLVLAALSEVVATCLLKNMKGVLKFFPILGISIASLAGFYFLFLAIRMMPMGVAYAIWSGAGIILVALSEVIIYEEPLDINTIIGMGFITTGVIILHLCAKEG